ncbi:MAG TPA: hypothetical protein VGE62_03350 [Candidatus Paceibacterota bacterium]
MKFKQRTLNQLADMVCGNSEDPSKSRFKYRSSSRLTEFFQDCDTDYVHDGSTRAVWVASVLEEILTAPSDGPNIPPTIFQAVVRNLMDPADATNESADRTEALATLNVALGREGFEAFYGEGGICYVRHLKTNVVATASNPHRPLSSSEREKREVLAHYLQIASEDELIEQVLLPLFRQLGFRRVTAAGHKDKVLEYGKDVWMKFTLPTMHVLYFAIQAKKDKLDAAGMTKNVNVAEVLAQIRMMLGHMVFDPEINKRALVDHAIIVSGGEITKQARNWLGEQLDASSRSQILFMERDDILDLYVVNNVPLPEVLVPRPMSDFPKEISVDDIPF